MLSTTPGTDECGFSDELAYGRNNRMTYIGKKTLNSDTASKATKSSANLLEACRVPLVSSEEIFIRQTA